MLYAMILQKIKVKQHRLEWVQKLRDWKSITHRQERADNKKNTECFEIFANDIRSSLGRTMTSDQVDLDKERRQAFQDEVLLLLDSSVKTLKFLVFLFSRAATYRPFTL